MQVTAMNKINTFLLLIFIPVMLAACSSSAPLTMMSYQKKRVMDLNEKALYAAERGNLQVAGQQLAEALRLSSSLDDREGQTLSLLNMARLSRRNNDAKSAADYADTALHVARGTAMLPDALQEKALQEIKAGNLKEARSFAERSLESEPGPLKGRRLNLLARISYLSGNLDECTIYLNKALPLNSTLALQEERANTIRLAGIVNMAKKNLKDAERELLEALAIDRELAIPLRLQKTLRHWAGFTEKQGTGEKQMSMVKEPKRQETTSNIR